VYKTDNKDETLLLPIDECLAFYEEALVMRQFNHPNIMSMYGVSVHEGLPCVVMPLMQNGDLKSYLRKNRSVSINIYILYIYFRI